MYSGWLHNFTYIYIEWNFDAIEAVPGKVLEALLNTTTAE